MSSQISKQPLAGFGVIMRHTQYMACESEVNKKRGYSWENIKLVMICYLNDIFASFILKQPTNRRINIHSPSSCAAVKAACKPLSSITEQLLLGSHIVPTSATPRVSQLFWPQMSCNTKTQRKCLNWSGANVWRRCCSGSIFFFFFTCSDERLKCWFNWYKLLKGRNRQLSWRSWRVKTRQDHLLNHFYKMKLGAWLHIIKINWN